MVIDPPQHQAAVQAETIASMQRCSHRKGFSKCYYKGNTAQKDMQVSRIGDAKPRVLINPIMIKGVGLKPAALRLKCIEQGGLIPTCG